MKKPIIWAHRGASGWDKQYAPENTLPAFQKAIEMGADGIEFDVQLTKDGEIVVIHDERIDRVSDGSGFVKDYTFAELKKFSFSKSHPEYGFVTIPTLRELFSFMQTNDKLMNVELKTGIIFYEGIEEKTAELAKKMGLAKRILYSSFNHESVMKIKKLAPDSKTAFLFGNLAADSAEYVSQHGIDAIHPARHLLEYPTLLQDCHEKNLKVNTWTVDVKLDMRRLAERGIDGFFTNCPDNARKIIDQWAAGEKFKV